MSPGNDNVSSLPDKRGMQRRFDYSDDSINLPPDAKVERRSIFIIGDKNSGKTTFSVMGLNSGEYNNSGQYARTLGLVDAAFVNVQYSPKKLQDHKGPYLDTDFGEGEYAFDLDVFSKTVGVSLKESYDVLELDVVEFGGDLLRRMRKYDRGEKLKEEKSNNEDARKRADLIKDACSATIGKLENFTGDDTVFYFVNLADLYSDSGGEMKRRFDKLVDRVNFIRNKNSKLKIKYVLNRLDALGEAAEVENFVQTFGDDSGFTIDVSLKSGEKYDEVIKKAVKKSFGKALSERGVNSKEDDLVVTYLLESESKVHSEDGFKLYEQIYSVSKRRDDISDLIIKSSLGFLAQNGEVSALQVEQSIRGKYKNSTIGAQFSEKVKQDFVSALDKLSDKGIVVRKCKNDKVPVAEHVHARLASGSSLVPRDVQAFMYCEKDVSPVQPPAYRISELDSIKDFVQLLDNNKIPVKVLEDDKLKINLPKSLIERIKKNGSQTYSRKRKLFREMVDKTASGKASDKEIAQALLDNIRDPYGKMSHFMEYSINEKKKSISRRNKDPIGVQEKFKEICDKSPKLEALALVPSAPPKVTDDHDSKGTAVSRIYKDIWINPKIKSGNLYLDKEAIDLLNKISKELGKIKEDYKKYLNK